MEEVLVVITSFVNLILWLFFFFYFKKRFSSQQILENIRQEVEKLIIEIDRVTDQDLSLVEDKMNALKELLEEADKHIKNVKKEQRKQKKEESAMIKMQEIVIPQEPVYENTVYTADSAVNRYMEASGTINSAPAEDIPKIVVKPAENIVKNEKSKKEKILELWKLGMEPERISEKLAVSLTEIRMVIDMYG